MLGARKNLTWSYISMTILQRALTMTCVYNAIRQVSISFANMYSLPGDPDSRRLNRNAVETRVHCLWNYLIETASHTTGSLLIWDTGEYEVLSRSEKRRQAESTDDSETDRVSESDRIGEQRKLKRAFHARKIKLRLHGTRLPSVSLRLTKENNRSEQPQRPLKRRKRTLFTIPRGIATDDSDSENSRAGLPTSKQQPMSLFNPNS